MLGNVCILENISSCPERERFSTMRRDYHLPSRGQIAPFSVASLLGYEDKIISGEQTFDLTGSKKANLFAH
jgi:hypothetical protein